MKNTKFLAIGLGSAAVSLGTGAASLIIANKNKKRIQNGEVELKGKKTEKVMKAVGLGAAIIVVAVGGAAVLGDDENNESSEDETYLAYDDEGYQIRVEGDSDEYEYGTAGQLKESLDENRKILSGLINQSEESTEEVF